MKSIINRQMKVIAFITDYQTVDRIIDHLKLRFIAEKRFLQILIESEELRPYIFAEVRDEDFKGLKSEPIYRIMRIILDHFKKNNDLIFHELHNPRHKTERDHPQAAEK